VSSPQNRCLPVMALAIATSLTLGISPAAAINCNKGYQRVQGNEIATPYCQDNYLAEVARSFGVRASAESIRNNPSVKRDVCRLVGRDIRVQQACSDSGITGRGGRF
jgi:hypothetical protein